MLENHFKLFRDQTIGINQTFMTPFGEKKMLYADWVASGRIYAPLEKVINEKVFPFCGNTHTETSITGTLMTKAYHEAKQFIKREINASEDDILIFEGSGMTGGINKLQRMLGLRIPEQLHKYNCVADIKPEDRPIVFVTHMEHHSNHTSWLETIADVEIINPNATGEVDLIHFQELIDKYQDRKLKIASITAASNVTGVMTPYYLMAEMIHQAGGFCFVDFACSGPYVHIDMHPAKESQQLDVVFISPHKFLGGPGTSGILVMNKCLYKNTIPDNSGGGTVKFTTPWKFHQYTDNIEEREDGGTPAFLQGIKTALCFKLKKEMGVENMLKREEELLEKVFTRLKKIENLHILAGNLEHRIGAVSFYITDLHFNLGVKLLNDYFGIQVRGGCACAGTYGHYLLNINQEQSNEIVEELNRGNLFVRPGWIRLSIHPTMSNEDVDLILDGIEYLANHHETMAKDYEYLPTKNIYKHKTYESSFATDFMQDLFEEKFEG